MSESWQVAFRTLREQFLQASREAFGLQLALTSFPRWEVYKRWYDERIDPEMKRKALQGRDQKLADSVWGDVAAVERYQALATAAGNALPIEFRPVTRLFPHWNEAANQNPPATTIWHEFLFVGQCQQFKITKHWTVPGCQVANLDGDPFLASALAIDRFLLRENEQGLAEYRSQIHSIFPGVDLANSSPGTSLPPASYGSGFLHFDLPAIFRCAVELGAAVAAQVEGSDSGDAETAGERLLHVLNPCQAKFPNNHNWREFQAMQRAGLDLQNLPEPEIGWVDSLDLAVASEPARKALLTIGLALADLRGDQQWHERGRDLLKAGTWHLWEGMGVADRGAVRSLLAETRRIWGWPEHPAGEPGPFTGPTATLSDSRILSPDWSTGTTADLHAMQDALRESNFLVDNIRLASVGRFPMYRFDCKPSMASLPSICPKAEPKPPLGLRPEGDMLADIEARYRALKLIGDDQTFHWVGRQLSPETTCTCDLTAPCNAPRPAEWPNLRQLRQAIAGLVSSVWELAGKQLSSQALEKLDRLSERVAGLTRALDLELPRFPNLPFDQAFRLRGPASVPVYILEDGIIMMAQEENIRRWESEWRAIRVAVDEKLRALDSQMLPCQAPKGAGLDTRDFPLEAPAGTPSPLREAFEAVARMLFQVADVLRQLPMGRPAFEENARVLTSAWRTARDRYLAAELLLQAVVENGGRCAHQEALTVAKGHIDAVGHIMLGTEPFHRAASNLLSVPPIDLTDLLRAMRAQVSRATLRLSPATIVTPIPTSPPEPLAPARHSVDFRSVHWYGTNYTFTKTQAACVKVLWEAMKNRTPELDQQTVLNEADSDNKRLSDVFKDSLAWGTLIVKGTTAGAFRLANPEQKT